MDATPGSFHQCAGHVQYRTRALDKSLPTAVKATR